MRLRDHDDLALRGAGGGGWVVGGLGRSGRGGEVGARAAGGLAVEGDGDRGGVGGEVGVVGVVGAWAGVGELLDGEGDRGGDEARGDDDFGFGWGGFGDGEAHFGDGCAWCGGQVTIELGMDVCVYLPCPMQLLQVLSGRQLRRGMGGSYVCITFDRGASCG